VRTQREVRRDPHDLLPAVGEYVADRRLRERGGVETAAAAGMSRSPSKA
jgi:hypothetical protein